MRDDPVKAELFKRLLPYLPDSWTVDPLRLAGLRSLLFRHPVFTENQLSGIARIAAELASDERYEWNKGLLGLMKLKLDDLQGYAVASISTKAIAEEKEQLRQKQKREWWKSLITDRLDEAQKDPSSFPWTGEDFSPRAILRLIAMLHSPELAFLSEDEVRRPMGIAQQTESGWEKATPGERAMLHALAAEFGVALPDLSNQKVVAETICTLLPAEHIIAA